MLILILLVVCPSLHKYDTYAFAVKVTESPEQIVVGPLTVIVDIGNWFTVTVTGLLFVHPVAVIVSVNV